MRFDMMDKNKCADEHGRQRFEKLAPKLSVLLVSRARQQESEKAWGVLIQTHAFYGTDVDIVIQTVIQTHAFYGTDVQTVQY